MNATKNMHPVTRVLTYIWIALIAIAVFFPVAYALLGAFHPTAELNQGLGNLIFGEWTLENFRNAWEQSAIGAQLINSFIVTICQTVAQFITSAIAAYALVFGNMKARNVLFVFFLLPIMLPNEVNNLVNFLTVSSFGLFDTVVGIFLPYLTSALALFLFYQAFRSFPKEIHEAAILDGVGPIKFLFRFAIPLNKSVAMTAMISSAIAAWNGYMWPLLITMSEEVRTIQPGIRSLADENVADTGLVLAGLLMASIPMIILVTFSQSFLSKGLTSGAVK
ncbi:carbohydrate ABC transporter permease [Auritidibacter sp. NML130574]|uniref:carbohydrate ABC transporter permease n=1 Tax=Auritidibacter sp. NML130574 TaxID=2170745 RepID=UPI001AEFAA42|nr:carbohydrate ABC transporter permease [Auritidibacter sp. NML130574]